MGFDLKTLLILSSLFLFSQSVSSQDIPRDGDIIVIKKETAIAICRKNEFINTNFLLMACVKQEQAAAKSIIKLIKEDKNNVSKAYWACVKNEFIDTHFLLKACIDQELKALKFLDE